MASILHKLTFGKLKSLLFYSITPARHQHTNTLQICGKGNPYETKIKRRRQVQDISYPDFEKQECLKWANWKMLRDVKRRIMNAQYWQFKLNTKNLATCEILPNVVREIAHEERNACPHNASVNRITNRCAMTSRARGKYYKYRLSRIVWRDQADHGMLAGNIRAKWG